MAGFKRLLRGEFHRVSEHSHSLCETRYPVQCRWRWIDSLHSRLTSSAMSGGSLCGSVLWVCDAGEHSKVRGIHSNNGPQRNGLRGDSGILRTLYTVANFTGLQWGDYQTPPDTMGAAGPSHFMTTLNSGNLSSVAVYNKYTGVKLSGATLNQL